MTLIVYAQMVETLGINTIFYAYKVVIFYCIAVLQNMS